MLSFVPPHREVWPKDRLIPDDGLAAFNMKPQEMEKIKKGICKVSHDNDLKITVEANTNKVNFLDVMPDLRSGKYYLYTKRATSHYMSIKNPTIHHPSSRTSLRPLTKGYLIYRIKNASIMLKASIKRHSTKVATTIISLSN